VISLENEILQARGAGAIDEAESARLIAIERREVFSIYAELRVLTWGGVMLIVGGVGVLVSKHLDQIGPVVIAAAIGLASSACYAFAWWKRSRAASLFDEYILLLGALLLSADVGYIESQFHLLDAHWPRHFLLLAVVHGAGAYLFGSRMLLSLSISALAAWIGVQRRVDRLLDGSMETGLRAIACSAVVLAWRELDRRGTGSPARPGGLRARPAFSPIFEHFAANLAFWGALLLVFRHDTRLIGAALAIVFAAISLAWGLRTNAVTFVLYAYVYGIIAIDVLICELLREDVLILLYLVFSTIVAIVGLFVTYSRFRALRSE